MKTLRNAIIVCLSVLSFSFVQCADAQNLPKTSSKYSVVQVDELYKKYLTEYKHDIMAPASLNTTFSNEFPNARDIEWEESTSMYRVEFEIGRQDYKAYYDKDGALVFYKREIYVNELPSIIKNAVLNKYPNFRIDDVEVYNKANVLTYEVKVEKGDLEYKVMLDDAGTILSEIMD